MQIIAPRTTPHKPVPRGIARSGPPLFSYGFRPFFLGAGLHALLAMGLWIGALAGLWSVGGSEGPIAWHAHEMLFGYCTAALAGFVLTAVPNWTGRLPVSGTPLAMLAGLWLLGRLAGLAPQLLGELISAGLDCLFLPALAFVVGREVVSGRNWKNLRVAGAISGLALLNLGYHLAQPFGGDPHLVLRLTVALLVTLVGLIGGRIIPSFTRNYLSKRGATRLPAPVGRFDQLAVGLALLAGAAWALWPDAAASAGLAAAAALVHALRLARWQGQATWREPLLLMLHLAYAFVPAGFVMLALASLGLVAPASALHVLTVGAIGLMTFAVMARASRGHTGRPLTASPVTTAAFAALLLDAAIRPLAEAMPSAYHLVLLLSGLLWLVGFGLFVAEHSRMLLTPSLR
jgi:uncharacterized protein involved in response to NO